ncbi:MAG: TetR/AcrR family transcriptional regulator [Peptostreptococcaceae bacterium]|nr:TetR/AcrR family transcriptional regulator [Peptostreptococcaceae bacterium]
MPKQLTEAEKASKKKLILDEARKMCGEMNFGDITMSKLALRCNIAKGTVFKYFETKETLFSIILYDEYAKWIESEAEDLKKIKSFTKESYKKFILEETEKIINEREMLVRLISIKRTILDNNVNVDELVKGMDDLTKGIKMLSVETAGKLDFLDVMDIFEFYEARHVIVVGGYNLALSINNRDKLKEMNEQRLIQVDFVRLVLKTTESQLKALLYC